MRIKVKILFIIIVSLLLVLSASTYYSQKVIEKKAEADLRDEVSKIVKQLDLNIVTAKRIANVNAIDENLKELMVVRPSIVRIDLFSFRDDGTLRPLISKKTLSVGQIRLTQKDIDQIKKDQVLLNLEKTDNVNYINVIAPVHFNDTIFGLIKLKKSRKEFDRLLERQRKHAFITAIISISFITSVLAISMNQIVLRPIQRLLGAVSRVRDGDLRVSVISKTKDEIGGLTESFNTMVQTIRKNTDEKESLLQQIHSFNEQLRYNIHLATEELQKRNEELRDANQSNYKLQKQLGHFRRLAAVGELAAMVAHELGTPLHSISGHLQLLMNEANLSSEVCRRVEIMQSQLERVIKSIQHILDTTRPPNVCFDWVDVNKLLEDIIILVFPEILSKQLTIEKEFQQGLPKIFGSYSQLQEVFLNLIDNAIDASPQCGIISIITQCITPHTDHHVLIEASLSAGYVQVSIKDNGTGIPQENLRHIFEPFYTTKDRGQGTGLGLAITQEIIHRHHGVVTVESGLDKGSIFSVQIPLRKNEHE